MSVLAGLGEDVAGSADGAAAIAEVFVSDDEGVAGGEGAEEFYLACFVVDVVVLSWELGVEVAVRGALAALVIADNAIVNVNLLATGFDRQIGIVDEAIGALVNQVEPIFDVVGIGDLDTAGPVAAIPARAARLPPEGAHLTHAFAARTEQRHAGVFPFKHAFESEQVAVDV